MLIDLKIKTPADLMDERSKLVSQSIDLMRKQARSNLKYAQKVNRIANKLLKLEEELRGEKL